MTIALINSSLVDHATCLVSIINISFRFVFLSISIFSEVWCLILLSDTHKKCHARFEVKRKRWQADEGISYYVQCIWLGPGTVQTDSIHTHSLVEQQQQNTKWNTDHGENDLFENEIHIIVVGLIYFWARKTCSENEETSKRQTNTKITWMW